MILFFMRFSIILFLLFPFFLVTNSELSVLYLSWQHDPTSTMMIHWHTATLADARIQYRKAGELVWKIQAGISVKLPETNVRINTVELYDLQAGAEYE